MTPGFECRPEATRRIQALQRGLSLRRRMQAGSTVGQRPLGPWALGAKKLKQGTGLDRFNPLLSVSKLFRCA